MGHQIFVRYTVGQDDDGAWRARVQLPPGAEANSEGDTAETAVAELIDALGKVRPELRLCVGAIGEGDNAKAAVADLCDSLVHLIADGAPDGIPLTRNDFSSLLPIPQPQTIPPPDRLWTDQEWSRIRRGRAPESMDDRWLAFVEDQRLYLHHSWTDSGVFEAQFEAAHGGWRITAAVAARPQGAIPVSDEEISEMLEGVIQQELLWSCGEDVLAFWT